MRLDIPFLPESSYTAFIQSHAQHIEAVHFGLFDSDTIDARQKFTLIDIDTLVEHLQQIGTVRKYLLLNSRLHHPGLYLDAEMIKPTLTKIGNLLDAGVLDGVVYADHYFLQLLADTDPGLACRLEAVPSVNFMIDCWAKLQSTMEALAATPFRAPGKIILDRSLNRRPEALNTLARQSHRVYPDIKLALLANEGCIAYCPFKPAHDSHIALSNIAVATDTHAINAALGCKRYFREQPHKLFRSPFIRPEDVARYEDSVDLIKLCGRTLGTAFLQRLVEAYIRRSYSGNLLDLLDSLDWMVPERYIANDQLPGDFCSRMSECNDDCRECNYCHELLAAHSHRPAFKLKDFRGSA